MDNKQYIRRGISFFFAALLILSGCATAKKPVASKHAEKNRLISSDVLTFRDLQQIDLDADGKKEIVAVYTTSSNSSGIRVIKINEKEKGLIIFEKTFDTPTETEFKVINDTPAIIVNKIDPLTKKKSKEVYSWNSKAFVLTAGCPAQ